MVQREVENRVKDKLKNFCLSMALCSSVGAADVFNKDSLNQRGCELESH